ncbi:fumarylacetoacetate hydrolase family protein [Nocardioides sp. YIM 152315]|uniref:2-keto-4-pentenoate hydratase n=1 Tax=Nocardioides sp. YIM 152315 TaxID=3031760 RepID=UPI0023DCA844|nr:fumarylacetoacetate hydrolase family protein [Nocardioides sp. YIM 152315]MDF1604487.1 fumarylacetoacetate hydrolase family protein [Nocardioides sp. YIM 152315]
MRDLIGAADVAAAYAVQRLLAEERLGAGGVAVGRKIGLTNPAVQRQLGVERPDFGTLFADMECAEDAPVPMDRLLQPKVEAEIAFVLARDLGDDEIDVEVARAAVGHAVAALEIVDSRIADWDITFGDTVADNASSGLYVLGATARALEDVEPVDVEMTMRVNGTTASTGEGRACLGDPLAALAWLASTARDLGEPLRAGEVVLSGALGPMVAVRAGDEVEADVTGLGSVRAVFGGAVR